MTAEDRYLSKIAGRLDRVREDEAPGLLSRPVLRVPVRILDRFLGGLRPGTVTLLDSGHLYVYDLVGMLCVQSVGELCGDVLYIDGGNLPNVTPTVVGKHGAKARPDKMARIIATPPLPQLIIIKITITAIKAAPAITKLPCWVRSKTVCGITPVTNRPAIIAIAK